MGGKLKIGGVIIATVVLILTIVSLSFLWLTARDLKLCYRTIEEASEGCAQVPRFQKAKEFNPQLGNAQDALVLLISIIYLIVHAILAYRWWSRRDTVEKDQRRRSVAIPVDGV